jgi:DNA polymerase III alpha subunit (gram-positive type)
MKAEDEWIRIDLHIHTLDDPRDALDYSAHQLLERARSLGFRVLAITLHDAVFDCPEVFADAPQWESCSFPRRKCGSKAPT